MRQRLIATGWVRWNSNQFLSYAVSSSLSGQNPVPVHDVPPHEIECFRPSLPTSHSSSQNLSVKVSLGFRIAELREPSNMYWLE